MAKMHMKVIGGSLDVEIDNDILADARRQLQKAADKKVTNDIKGEKLKPNVEQEVDKLNPTHKMPI